MKTREELIDAVIAELKADILSGDVTVLEEILGFVEKDKLVESLPEERWSEFRTSSDYFSIKATGFNEVIQREEIQIHCGENGNLMIYKTPEGFVVDAYDANGENIDTMAIWEDGINPLVEGEDCIKDDEGNCAFCGQKCWEGEMCDEQQGDGFQEPTCFSPAELREFIEEWGQTHHEICAELEYWENGNDTQDLLMVDYFWLEPMNVWLPKLSSMYTERQEAIAKFLRLG
jgi:hypothetical protein